MFKVNDIVKVKNMPLPVLAEDHKTDMRNWQGVVTEVHHASEDVTYVVVRFDSLTLRELPKAFLVYSAKLEEIFWEYAFRATALEKTEARDKPNDWKKVKKLLLASETWVQAVASWKRIDDLLLEIGSESDYLDGWLMHLDAVFQDPVRAMYTGSAFDHIYFGAQVTITEILGFDHTWGIFVEVQFDGHTMEVPLYMLEIQEEGNHTFGLRDYALWHTDEYIPEHMGKLRGFGSSD